MDINITENKHGLAIVCILASLSTMAYFPFIELLNRASITVNPNAYALYNYIVFGASTFSSFISFVFLKGRIKIGAARGIGLVSLITILFFIYGIFFEENGGLFIFFYLWAVPALLVGMFIPTINNLAIIKLLEPLALIMGISAVVSARRYISLGVSHLNTLSFGGTNYQGLSYTAAFCVGLELYFVFLASDKNRFSFFRGKIGKFIESFVGVGAGWAVIVSGGRGGSLLMVLNGLIFLLLLKKKNKYGRRGNRVIHFLLIILIVLLAFLLIRYFSGNTLISDSIDRLTSYINNSSDKSAWNTGRKNIYKEAIQSITNNPILGYGFFNISVLRGEPYPHNMIIETWMNAGFLYMIMWLAILISLWRFFLRLSIKNSDYGWLLFFLTYSTIFLSVSGTYLWCSELWFLIGVMLSGNILVSKAG